MIIVKRFWENDSSDSCIFVKVGKVYNGLNNHESIAPKIKHQYFTMAENATLTIN
jgi:hypothetical protein